MSEREHLEHMEYYSSAVMGSLYRCPICWIDSPHKNMDNGFIPTSQEYQHASYCGKGERRNQTPDGKLRRLQEKNMLTCEKCFPKLCTCEDRNEHGIRQDGVRTNKPIKRK